MILEAFFINPQALNQLIHYGSLQSSLHFFMSLNLLRYKLNTIIYYENISVIIMFHLWSTGLGVRRFSIYFPLSTLLAILSYIGHLTHLHPSVLTCTQQQLDQKIFTVSRWYASMIFSSETIIFNGYLCISKFPAFFFCRIFSLQIKLSFIPKELHYIYFSAGQSCSEF